MSKTKALIQLQQEQALRAATVQVEKILYQSEPLTIKQIQSKSWFRRKLLRQACELHPRIIGHGPKGKQRQYSIELERGHPIPQLEQRLNSQKARTNKSTPGSRSKKDKS